MQDQQASTKSLAERLDVVSVAKAQRAISGEILMDRLAQTLLRIAMENAGARYGYLSVKGGAEIEAEMKHGDKGVPQIVFDSSLDGAGLPTAILNYVMRTRETVILPDASDADRLPFETRTENDTEGRRLSRRPVGCARSRARQLKFGFQNDEYLRRTAPKSAMCVPIQRKDALLGVLYLENDLVVGAFTPERRAVLEMLASQAAISLETASIYEALKRSELNYSRIVNTATEGIWVVGPDMLTSFVNARMAGLLGCSPEEMLGRPPTEFMFEEDVPQHLKYMENRRRGIPERYERRFRHRDGRAVWCLASATPVFDDAGRFMGSGECRSSGHWRS